MSRFKINYKGKNTFLVPHVTKVVVEGEPDYVYIITEEMKPERMWFAIREDDHDIGTAVYNNEILEIRNLGEGLDSNIPTEAPMLSQDSFNSLEKDIASIDIEQEKKELEDSLKSISTPSSKVIKAFGKKSEPIDDITKEQVARRKAELLRERIIREQETKQKQGTKAINKFIAKDAPFPEMDEEEKQLIKALLRMGLKTIERKIDAW